MGRIYVLLTVVLGIANSSFANGTLVEAHDLYKNGKFIEAIELYQSMLDDGYEQAELLYNLGNCYFRLDELGEAIMYFEKAHTLSPGDDDVRHNLEVARSRIESPLSTVKPFFVSAWWNKVSGSMSSTVWSKWLFVLLIFMAGMIGLWLFGTNRINKKRGFIFAIIFAFLAILVLFLGSSKYNTEMRSGRGIVLEQDVILRSGPDEKSQEVLDLSEGIEVKISEQIGDWYLVICSNGEKGWLPMQVVGKI